MIQLHRYLPLLLVGSLSLRTTQVAHAQGSLADQRLVQQVSSRLLVVTDPPPAYPWPPAFEIEPSPKLNASARRRGFLVSVSITEGMLAHVIEGDADRLAGILGHELAHHALGHVKASASSTRLLKAIFGREEELAADVRGMQIAIAAGFSYRGALKAPQRMVEIGADYSSYEGLSSDHPTWKDRLAILDRDQSSLWQAMRAFDNGTLFASVEQYAAAEKCFREVTLEFPACHEAWANLGYVRLMQYCDAFETADLRRFGIGQVAIGAFYHRPKSLESAVRGIDEQLWFDAVSALRQALILKPALSLAKSNLGVAYLVRPAGKDLEQAMRCFSEAITDADAEGAQRLGAWAALHNNAAVADFAANRPEAAAANLKLALRQLRIDAEPTQLTLDDATLRLAPNVLPALLYNIAFPLSASSSEESRRLAVAKFENYLSVANPTSAYWTLASERYQQLCQSLSLPIKSEAQLGALRRLKLRPFTSVEVAPKRVIALSDPVADVKRRLGANPPTITMPGTNLSVLCYPLFGIEVLATSQVLAVKLKHDAVPLKLSASGLTADTVLLRPGIPMAELDKLLAQEPSEFIYLADPQVWYRFYPGIGLAVRTSPHGVATELVVVQVPRK